MGRKIGILYTGFSRYYIKELLRLFYSEGIYCDIYSFSPINEELFGTDIYYLKDMPDFHKKKEIEQFEKEFKALIKDKNYEFVLADTAALSFTCNIFHNVSTAEKILSPANPIYKMILYIGHLNKILFEKRYYKNSPHTFVVSSRMKEDYEKNYSIPKDKITVIYPGADCAKPEDITQSKKNKDTEDFVIGLSANGFVTKGGYVLLEALRVLKRDYPEIKFKARIIYPKHKKNMLLNLYMKLFGLKKNVELLPFQNGMKDFYNSLHCFACASRFEAFGRVVTEAMSYGLPVIVGSAIGASDIIRDGENGYVYKVGKNTSKNFADKIAYIYKNYYSLTELRKEARVTSEKYTWEEFAKGIFHTLIKSKIAH